MNISKKGQFFLFPPSELTEYLVLISPPEDIKKEIRKIKNKLHKMTEKTVETTYNVAHISLFKTAWEKDSHIIGRLKKALNDVQSFSISVNGIETFSNGTKKKTIYFKVENSKPILALYKACKTDLKLRKDFTPYLTLEKNISPSDFEKIQDRLEDFNYPCNWICDRITVLKFNPKSNSYKMVEEISLLSSPAS